VSTLDKSTHGTSEYSCLVSILVINRDERRDNIVSLVE